MSSFDEMVFRRQVDACLTKVRLLLNSNRASTLGTADAIPHKYDDKYMLADYLTNTAAVCQLTCLKALGLTSFQIATLKNWNLSKDISIRFESKETCEFVEEVRREVDSDGKYVVESSFLGKITSKVVTTVTEYHYLFNVSWELLAYRGVGNKVEDRMVIQSRNAQQTCIMRAKSMPFPEVAAERFDVNISWLFQHMSDTSDEMDFHINRSHKDCHTPRRNINIATAENCFRDFSAWCVNVDTYVTALMNVQKKYTENCNINTDVMRVNDVFVPVIPLMSGDSTTMAVSEETEEESTEGVVDDGSDHNDSSSTTAVAIPAADSSTMTVPDTAVSLSPTTVNALLSEQERNLLAKCAEMETAYPAPTAGPTIITASEAKVVVVCRHMIDVVNHFFDGINFIEELIRKQLVSAVGKELQPSDFSAYMQFHNRKLLRAEYQPKPFTHSVRRSVTHSPEGTLRIEDSVAGGSTATVAESIFTVSHSAAPSASNKMEFTLNAATTVKFGGDRHVHGWLAHSFSGDSLPQLNLVAQARQFSSFIVLVGSIASATVFQPKHAFIVQNKDEVVIPLLLETLPTPKQFRDAIESLSPEQQRFAKAFRSMQLESTLFGVCVIQIKPQLEKVLDLAPDSLTKEIQLTQDLMKLFIEYQIPTDLMSFEGDRGASAATRLEAVRGHVKAMNDMLDKAKTQELAEKEQERLYHLGPPPPPRRTLPEAVLEQSLYLERLGDNIDNIMSRGESLETLAVQGDTLRKESLQFKRSSAKMKKGGGGSITGSIAGFVGGMLGGGGGGSSGGGGAVKINKKMSSSSSASPPLTSLKSEIRPGVAIQMKSEGGGPPTLAPAPRVTSTAATTAATTATAPHPSAVTTAVASEATSVHVVVNAPGGESSAGRESTAAETLTTQTQGDLVSGGGDGHDATAADYTQIPAALDRNYEKFDCDSALRPTIITVGTEWTKRSQAALLAKAASKTLHADEQTREKTAAFDLLDALSRSGALCIEDASLHVLIAATHSFDQSLMDTVVKGNVNPIEWVERSTLIMASTLHGVPAAQLVADNQLDRVAIFSPGLFVVENVGDDNEEDAGGENND